MSPERLQQVEELFHWALEKTAAGRAELLSQADPEIRHEVESLLAAHGDAGFLEEPAMQNASLLAGGTIVTQAEMPASLGPYRLESRLGAGGMGKVFRAVDTRLGRAVAIKTSHAQFSARFEREARAISSLNHPHICTLYDVGPNYLVMELVEGETLAARLRNGALPVELALSFAAQIASALTEAHSKRIIHRDLKPSNIMIAKTGVKVLDFGLAKLGHEETVNASHMVMGTPAYMAPEQREGKPVDARADIYAFGLILYEMLTGERSRTKRKRCPLPKLDRLIDRCLEEDPEHRWQSASDIERELSAAVLTRRALPVAAVAAGALAAILLVASYLYFPRTPKIAAKGAVILADFDNKTDDPVFDDTLRLGLTVELQQSPVLTLLSDWRIQQELALMGQPKQTRLTPDLARQMCERTGSTAVLEGSIATLGSQYVLGLRARNCTTGNIMDQDQVVAARKEDVLTALTQVARRFRTRVGESLAAVEMRSPPLAQVTTASLEALKAFTAANGLNVSSASGADIPFLRRAVEIDPQFAMAHAYLGLSYSNLGESALAAESATKAFELRHRVTDRERHFIEFSYHRHATGNLEKAYQALETWLQAYPRGKETASELGPMNPQGLMGGLSTHGTGRYERAREALHKEIAVDPNYVIAYMALASNYFLTSRFAETADTLRRAAERNLDAPILAVIRFNLAALHGDQGQMDQLAAQARGKRRLDHLMPHQESLAHFRFGRLQAARLASTRSVDLALQESAREEAANYHCTRALWEVLAGNLAEGRSSAAAALELSSGRDVQFVAGLALALSGDAARAEALAQSMAERLPEDTFAKFTYVPVLGGAASLARGKAKESIETLQTALRYELAVNGLNFNHFVLGGLHSAYVRGRALLVLNRHAEAAAEFQKILDNPGLVALDPIGPLAQLHLATAHAASGDGARAKAAYDAFFRLWKNADPAIPVLRQARAEYARLP
jgi:tetratricopeptide (TPR) repeat protein